MKHSHLVLTAIAFILCIALIGCKKEQPEILTPKITNEKVETTTTAATFTWTVDWPGKIISVVEVSENEDMSHSQIIGSEEETENHNFTVTASGLKEGTVYYFRYLVWNKFYVDDKFVMEKKNFATKVDWPNGRLPGVFSISDTRKVYFSQGNLQYRASTNTWRFADYQWDYVGTLTPYYEGNVGGTVVGSDNADMSQTYNGWIDLFGWGTSGWNNGNTFYRPWDNAGISYASSYGPPGYYDLTDNYAKADWGVYNPISNGGNTANRWRTLTKDEWNYVLNARGTLSGIRFVRANVNEVNGIILLPDNWDNYTTNSSISQGHNYNSNVIDYTTWISMEINGAVFLPAAGERWSADEIALPGESVCYWTASCDEEMISRAYLIDQFGRIEYVGRHYGFSVRLVQDVN